MANKNIEDEIRIYEKLLPNECYILSRIGKSFLVAKNENGDIKVKYVKIEGIK